MTKKDKAFRNQLDERRRKFDERLNRRILAPDVASVSSNVKWSKVFELLETQIPGNIGAEVKLLMGQEPFVLDDFMNSCFEEEYFDGPHGGFWYRELEWVKLPMQSNPDFDFQVDCEILGGVIKIYGYRVNNS